MIEKLIDRIARIKEQHEFVGPANTKLTIIVVADDDVETIDMRKIENLRDKFTKYILEENFKYKDVMSIGERTPLKFVIIVNKLEYLQLQGTLFDDNLMLL
jgi:hypothetical protein